MLTNRQEILLFKNLPYLEYEEERPLASFKEYSKNVWTMTESIAHSIPMIERRGWRDHHIDHIKSIWFCWKNGISAEQAADISNLRMLPYKENMAKGRKCI